MTPLLQKTARVLSLGAMEIVVILLGGMLFPFAVWLFTLSLLPRSLDVPLILIGAIGGGFLGWRFYVSDLDWFTD